MNPLAVVAVEDVQWRTRAAVEGVVTSLLVRPMADVPTVEVRVSDATGTLPAIFLGRRSVPGIRLGTRIAVEGMVGIHGRNLATINPEYRLLAD